jgi:hypothetical protein
MLEAFRIGCDYLQKSLGYTQGVGGIFGEVATYLQETFKINNVPPYFMNHMKSQEGKHVAGVISMKVLSVMKENEHGLHFLCRRRVKVS